MELTPTSPVYGISVAAQLTGMDPQTLRAYEARGLIAPHRTAGGTRRYSDHDLLLVQRITELLAAGLTLSGVAAVLGLEEENRRPAGRTRPPAGATGLGGRPPAPAGELTGAPEERRATSPNRSAV